MPLFKSIVHSGENGEAMHKANTEGCYAPEPLVMGHHQRVAEPDEAPRHRVHNEHLMGLLLQGEGEYRLGPDEMVLGAPVMWFLPEGEPEVIALHGQIHGWWVSFGWPGWNVQPQGRQIEISWGGSARLMPRWKVV